MKRFQGSICWRPLVAGLALALLPLGAPAQETVDAEGPLPVQFLPEPIPAETTMATINGEEYDLLTIQFLWGGVPSERLNLRAIELPRLAGEEQWEYIAKSVGAMDLVAEKAREEGFELDDAGIARLDREMRNWLGSALYRENVEAKLGEPTQMELDAIYEEMRETSFKILERLVFRHIFVSTYKEYTVKEGDTLASIATEVSGNPDAVDQILSMESKKPRIEELETEVENEEGEQIALPARPLVPGEVLMVPMSEEELAGPRGKIEAAHARLEAGGDFEEVAKEFSEAAQPGQRLTVYPEKQDRPLNETVVETFLSLEDGAYSQPVRTRHGFQIVQRLNYIEGGYRDRDASEQSLRTTFRNRQQGRLINEFFRQALETEGVAEIDTALAMEGTENADVLVTIGDEEFTRQQVATSLAREAAEKFPGESEDELMDLLAEARALQGALVQSYAEVTGLVGSDEYELMRERLGTNLLVRQYFQRQVDNLEISDEQIEKYYEDNKDDFLEREMYDVSSIVIPITGEKDEAAARAELAEAIAGVESRQQFRQVANQFADLPDNPTPRNGTLGRMVPERFSDADLAAVRAAQTPGLTELIANDEQVIVYWVETAQAERQRPLEEVRESIESTLRGREGNDLIRDLFRAQFAESEVELLADVTHPESGN